MRVLRRGAGSSITRMSITRIRSSRRAVVLGLLPAALLSGCARYYYGDHYGPLLEEGGGRMLGQNTRAAVDRLLGGSEPVPTGPVWVRPLTEAGTEGRMSGFGRVVAAQLASELAARGVALAGGDEPSSSAASAWRTLDAAMQSRGAPLQLSGSYVVAARQVYVSLRLAHADQAVLAAVDYAVVLDDDVRALLRA